MSRTATVSSLLAALTLLVAPVESGIPIAQMDAAYLADVEDRKITRSYSASDNATEVSLALVPLVPEGMGGITFVLKARFSGRKPRVGAVPDLGLRVHYRFLSDERRRAVRALAEDYALSIRVDVDGKNGVTLPFFPANFGYVGFKIAGDELPVLWFTLTPDDLRALTVADRLSGRVAWTDFFLTRAQLEALRDFAARVLPTDT